MTTHENQTEMEDAPRAPLATRTADPPVVRTPRAIVLKQALEEEREQRVILRQYVSEYMVEGEDYGTIPGVKRRSLLKPGAEKVMDLFRCRPEYEVMAKEVNHETGLFYFEIRCRAVNRETDTVLNEGLGSASSYESRYRYRHAGRLCPKCGKDTIIKGKEEFGGGWLCFAKKGGCGAKWADGAPEIESQEVGRVQNPDLADVANVVLKIAKKRAQVDCAIALARFSDLFTQDVEDLGPTAIAEEERRPPTPKERALALWNRAGSLGVEPRKKAWATACSAVFRGRVPATDKWTMPQVAAVEAELFKPKDAVAEAAEMLGTNRTATDVAALDQEFEETEGQS